MNILVVGGAGYIGSHTCKMLKKDGFTPIVFDDFSTGHRDFIRWGPSFEGNIGDLDSIIEALSIYKPIAVIHFAARAYVGESINKPIEYYSTNVCGTLNLLKAMKHCSVQNLVFSSSCATYGCVDLVPITESTAQQPVNPYGRTKLICEQMIIDTASEFDLNYTCLRYFNAAGADPECEVGEKHSPETHIIPILLECCADKSKVFEIFGDDYDTPDGTCIRDFVHVMDLASAHSKALHNLVNNKTSGCYNIGTKKGYSVRELISNVEHVSGKKIRTRVVDRRIGDPPELVADSRAAAVELNWTPQYTQIRDIIQTAWEWQNLQAKRVPTSDH